MFLRVFVTILLTSLLALTDFACSGRFVVREKLRALNDELAKDKIYLLKEDVEIGNGEKLAKGSRVRIYVSSDSFSVKVKAYRHDEIRESVIAKNIIFMYEGQFKNEEFEKEVFMKEFNRLLQLEVAPAK